MFGSETTSCYDVKKLVNVQGYEKGSSLRMTGNEMWMMDHLRITSLLGLRSREIDREWRVLC